MGPTPKDMNRQSAPKRQMEDHDRDEVTEPPSKSHKSSDHGPERATRSFSLADPVANATQHRECSPPSFEGLPPEIRLHIVDSGLGIEDLRAAVRASPALHRQYRLADRRLMLRAALSTSLGPALVDMWAVHTTAKMDFGHPLRREKERIAMFMTEYMELRDSWPHGSELHTDYLVEMSKYYLLVVMPLLDYFSSLLRNNLHEQMKAALRSRPGTSVDSSTAVSSISGHGSSLSTDSWHAPYEDGEQVDGLAPQDKVIFQSGFGVYCQRSLSTAETIRLTRALYRIQLWCNLYGYGISCSGLGPYKSPGVVSCWEMVCMFHETFEPWEVEEMLCIYQHMRVIIERLFKDMRKHLLRCDGRPKGEIGFFNGGNSMREYDSRVDWFIRHAVSQGLAPFNSILSLPHNDQDTRLRVVTESLINRYTNDLLSSVSRNTARRRYHPSGNDLREIEREPLLFLGDSVANPRGPPFFWCLMWKGTYSNRYGGAIPEALRNLGYIFWDRERVVGSRARELLLKTWRSHHEEDPRTTLI